MNVIKAVAKVALACGALFASSSYAAYGDPTIRVHTAYTSAANTYMGGNPGPTVAAEIARINQAFANSGIALWVENAGISGGVLGGGWADAEQARDNIKWDVYTSVAHDAYNADITMLLIYTSASPSKLGAAWSIPAVATSPFAAVEMAGLSAYSYVHEFGHVLGARHQSTGGDLGNDGLNTPYAYGHGWYATLGAGFSGGPDCKHTIMAYKKTITGTNACVSTRELMFSSPTLQYCFWYGGSCVAMGNSIGGNNAQVLRNIGPSVTAFRNTKLATKFYSATIVTTIFNLLN